LFLDVERETAAAESSIGRVYPDRVTDLMRRSLPLMQRMFDYYRAQRTKMDADLEQLLVQRLEETTPANRLRAVTALKAG
jgi:hypothetical protein